MITLQSKAFIMKSKIKEGVKKMVSKMPGDSQIVVALVLIAVAIGLCIIFRNQIFKIMQNLFDTIGKQIENLTKGDIVTTGGGSGT